MDLKTINGRRTILKYEEGGLKTMRVSRLGMDGRMASDMMGISMTLRSLCKSMSLTIPRCVVYIRLVLIMVWSLLRYRATTMTDYRSDG